MAIFTARDNMPPVAAYATLDTRGTVDPHLVLDFDGATDEEAVFESVLPANYAGGGLTISCWCAWTSATSGTFQLQGAVERMDVSSLDIDAASFVSLAAFSSGTAPGTSGQFTIVTLALTSGANMDSLVAGEAYRVKIRRDADGTSGTDNITTDMELLRVRVSET